MKKLLLILFVVQNIIYAQTIPNGGFENWTNLNFDNPDHWFSANQDIGREKGEFTITKVSGSTGFAIRLETKGTLSDITEAWISTTNGDPRSGEGGDAYSQKPETLIGKYRCSIKPGDTAFVVAIFKKNGTIMGGSTATFTGNVSGFTNFSFPVLIGGVPDSVIVAAGSSNLINEEGVQPGSWIEFDDLGFGGVGITQGILNGNFENWTNTSSSVIQDWNVSGNEGLSKIDDPFRGNSAVSLTTFNHPQDGLRQCVLRLATEENQGQIIKRGVPFNLPIDTLFGYYKLSSSGPDHSYIFARTFKNGLELGWFGKELNASASYQYFEIILNSGTTPDSLDVVIESSSQGTMIEGTKLIIDEVQLKSSKLNTSGIVVSRPFTRGLTQVYPNPTNGLLNIQTGVKGSIDIRVFNINGMEMLHQNLGSDRERSLDMAGLESGLYLIQIADEGGGQSVHRFVKE